MIIVLNCPGCQKRYEIDGALAGKKSRCRECGEIFRIPVPNGRMVEPSRSLAITAPPSAERQPVVSAPPRSSPARPRMSTPAAPPGIRPPTDGITVQPPLPTRVVKSAASADEELPLRPRAFDQPSRRSKSRDASTASDLGTTALSWFVLFDAVATLLLYAYLATGESGDLQRIRIFTICQGLILGGAFVLALWGVIWLLCMAFVESLFQGVLCLFVPLYSLFFCLSRWDERKGAFGLTMAPFAAILVTLIIGWAAVGTRKVNDGLHGTGQATNETAPADPRNPAPPTNNPQRSNTRSAGGSKAVAPNLRQEYGDRIVAVVVIGMPGHDNPARGATNRDVTTAVSQRLKELAPESVRSQMVYANERLSIVMAPVDDAQGLASRIDFGTVTLNGDRIEVRLDPRYVARVPRLPAESTPEPRTALRRDPVRTPDPEVPVGADSTTRSLIELKSSEVHKKKQAIDRLQRDARRTRGSGRPGDDPAAR